MPLRRPQYVTDLLSVDPRKTESIADFLVKYHAGVGDLAAEGRSPAEAFRAARRRKSVTAAKDEEERRILEMAEIIREHDPLPRPTELRTAMELTQDLIDSFDPWRDDAFADSRPMRAAIIQLNTFLEDAQPIVELTDDGLLHLSHQVRPASMGAGSNRWWLRAVLELVEANALDPTESEISRAKSKAEARVVADRIHDRIRGLIERRIVRDSLRGRTSTVLSRIYGLPRTTVSDIVKRGRGCEPARARSRRS